MSFDPGTKIFFYWFPELYPLVCVLEMRALYLALLIGLFCSGTKELKNVRCECYQPGSHFQMVVFSCIILFLFLGPSACPRKTSNNLWWSRSYLCHCFWWMCKNVWFPQIWKGQNLIHTVHYNLMYDIILQLDKILKFQKLYFWRVLLTFFLWGEMCPILKLWSLVMMEDWCFWRLPMGTFICLTHSVAHLWVIVTLGSFCIGVLAPQVLILFDSLFTFTSAINIQCEACFKWCNFGGLFQPRGNVCNFRFVIHCSLGDHYQYFAWHFLLILRDVICCC